jgi:predicted GNAT superfamily acetyltransferase
VYGARVTRYVAKQTHAAESNLALFHDIPAFSMQSLVIRDATTTDFHAICALNSADVQHTSPMDATRLAYLAQLACFHRVAYVDDVVAAFVLAMRDGAPYENDNFAWFAQKYPRFIYIDRVLVSSAHRGLRLGSMLYEDLFNYARQQNIPVVTCEYNLVPPNEPSKSFHDKFGFQEQGSQWVANGTKRVSLQAAECDPSR